jgi:hypothetical protein
MPSKKIKGLSEAKKGERFLLIKESKQDKFIVQKLKKKR